MIWALFRSSAFAALALTAGCQDGGGLKAVAEPAKPPLETRVFYSTERCVFDGSTAQSAILVALAAAAIPALVSAGTGVIGDFLAAQAEPKPATAQASANLFVENGKFPVCVQVIRGRFRASPYDIPETDVDTLVPMPPWFVGEMAKATRDDGKSIAGYDRTAWRRLSVILSSSGLTMYEWPDAFVEVVVRRSTVGGAVAWAPTFVGYDHPMEAHTFRSNSRNQSLTLALFAPGKKELMATVNFGEVRPGTRALLNTAALERLITLHDRRAENQVSAAVLNSAMLRNESSWLVPELEATGPATVKVVMTETKDKNEFFALMSNLFKTGKATIDKGVGDYALSFLPKQPDLSKEAAAAKEYASNYNAALAGLNECAQLPDPVPTDTAGKVALATKMRSVYALQLAANITAASAGGQPIFAQADLITPGKKPQDCAAARDKALKQTINP